MRINRNTIIFIIFFGLLAGNFYLILKIKNLQIEREIVQRELAERYSAQLEYQRELTKDSINTVSETNDLYISLNSELQQENDRLQHDLQKMLENDECANSNIPDNIRRRVFTQ